MRNILAVIGLLVVGFAGLGWYLGWYKLSVSRGSEGKLQITTDVDTKKVGDDAKEAFNNAANAINNHAQDAKAPTPGATPGPLTPPQNLPSIPAVSGPPVPPAAELPKIPIPPAPTASGPITLIPPK